MTTDDARATLAALETKRADLSRREIELATEGKRLSLAALTGDTAAKKALASLDAEALRLGLDMRHMRSAIEAQKAVVVEAVRAEEIAARREAAFSEREEFEKTRALAAKLNSALETLVGGLPELLDRLATHKKRGFLTSNGTWTAVIIRSISGRLFHAFHPLQSDYFRVSAMRDIHPIDKTVEDHLTGGLRNLAAVLGEQQREAA